MCSFSKEPFARTEKPLDMAHYDLSTDDAKGGIMIVCVDGRFYKPGNSALDALVNALVEKRAWRFYDLIVWAGGIRVLASKEGEDAADKEALLGRIEQSIALHCKERGASGVEIVMVNHDDCGGYGYRAAFGNDLEAQARRYCADFESAENEIRERISSDISGFLPLIAMADGGIYPAKKED